MIWAILSVLSGLGDAISFAAIKKLGKFDTILTLAARYLMALPFILAMFLFYEIPKVKPSFYFILSIDILILFAGMYLLIRSLETSDMSVAIPMLNFSPVFLLFVSYFFLNELPNISGLIGVLIVVAGSYILNIASMRKGYLEPFKEIFNNRGIFYMLIVAFLFSISATISKIGILMSNPAYFTFMEYLVSSIVILPFCFSRFAKNSKSIKRKINYLIIIGLSTAAMTVTYAIAVKYTLISYIISLKRTSIMFSVLIGFFLFKEKNFKSAIIGSAVMLAGAVLIILS
ncbi:DMT family transporter [Candidatus Woesearchaeota archaeon]|nr:DMT family transporter [Candidatus Woesearchaeota archaeon]